MLSETISLSPGTLLCRLMAAPQITDTHTARRLFAEVADTHLL